MTYVPAFTNHPIVFFFYFTMEEMPLFPSEANSSVFPLFFAWSLAYPALGDFALLIVYLLYCI